jgi:hypothetical protein
MRKLLRLAVHAVMAFTMGLAIAGASGGPMTSLPQRA